MHFVPCKRMNDECNACERRERERLMYGEMLDDLFIRMVRAYYMYSTVQHLNVCVCVFFCFFFFRLLLSLLLVLISLRKTKNRATANDNDDKRRRVCFCFVFAFLLLLFECVCVDCDCYDDDANDWDCKMSFARIMYSITRTFKGIAIIKNGTNANLKKSNGHGSLICLIKYFEFKYKCNQIYTFLVCARNVNFVKDDIQCTSRWSFIQLVFVFLSHISPWIFAYIHSVTIEPQISPRPLHPYMRSLLSLIQNVNFAKCD